MKKNKIDFIGGQSPLTASEEKQLSDFFRERKLLSKTSVKPKLKTPIHSKEVA